MPDTDSAIISATVPLTANGAYFAWLDPKLLPQWLAPPPYNLIHADVEPRVGGHYRHVTTGPDGEHIVAGEYQELQLGKCIVKTWIYRGPNPAPRPESTTVYVEFCPDRDGNTKVTITHSGLRDEAEHIHYSEGWAHCLQRLQRLCTRTA